MAVSVSLKLSADAGNQMSFAADAGIFVPTPTPRGGPYGYTLDNSIVTPAAAATYFYALPWGGFTSYTWQANTAQVSPLLVARDCRITDAAINVAGAGAGSQIYHSLFASDSTGLIGAKVADLFRFDTTATGMRAATLMSPSTILSGSKLYWTVTWANTTNAYPATSNRSPAVALWSLRMADRPQISTYFTSSVQSQIETAQSWSTLTAAPTTIAPTATVGTAAPTTSITTAPHIWYGLYNV